MTLFLLIYQAQLDVLCMRCLQFVACSVCRDSEVEAMRLSVAIATEAFAHGGAACVFVSLPSFSC